MDAGSTVEDAMGYKEGEYNFDLVNDADALELKVGTKKLKAVSISTSDEQDVYAFGDKLTDGTYPYVLTYTKTTDENEKFVLTFNVPVSNFNRVELTYSVKLVSAVTKTGTYGQYDRDGSQGFDGWYTNNYAVLKPLMEVRMTFMSGFYYQDKLCCNDPGLFTYIYAARRLHQNLQTHKTE